MKGWIRISVVSIVLLILAGGWVYLFVNSRAISVDQQNIVLGNLKELKQLDSDWNSNVLKSQAEINLTYDPLTQPLRRFSDLIAILEDGVKKLDDHDLIKPIQAMGLIFDEKAALIDRFKAQNAVLKNSLHYIPTENKNIQNQIKQLKNASNEKNALFLLSNLESKVNALVNEALRYNSVPDEETQKNLVAQIDGMFSVAGQYDPSIRSGIENLTKHVSVILRLRNIQSDLLAEISELPIASKIDKLMNVLDDRFASELKQQYIYQQSLLYYSATVLLLVFGFSALVFYRSATERKRLIVLVDKQTREIKENEGQLIHAQKMNALGEMVAGITHEVNTPLASVKNAFQCSREMLDTVFNYINESRKLNFMLSTPPSKDEVALKERRATLGKLLVKVNKLEKEITSFDTQQTVEELMTDAVRNVDYIHQVVVNMLNFSRLDRSKIAKVKVETGIENTLTMARHMLKNVSLVKEFGDTEAVSCDIAQINQVLLNLIKNAAQALPDSTGKIIVRTSMHSSKEVSIAVIDNGSGISEEILSKIWEPFFTTKIAGSGTGLGLSTCKKIITSHGGKIEVTSVVGEGTTFTIVLPITPPDSLYEACGQSVSQQLVAAA